MPNKHFNIFSISKFHLNVYGPKPELFKSITAVCLRVAIPQ